MRTNQQLPAGRQIDDNAGFSVDDLMAGKPDHKAVGTKHGAPDGWKIRPPVAFSNTGLQEFVRHRPTPWVYPHACASTWTAFLSVINFPPRSAKPCLRRPLDFLQMIPKLTDPLHEGAAPLQSRLGPVIDLQDD